MDKEQVQVQESPTPEAQEPPKPESEKKPPRRIGALTEIPAPAPKVFEFVQNAEKLAVEYWPLTAQEVEAIRASIPEPEPPSKQVGGAKEVMHLRERGFPTTFKDTGDPAYLEAVKRRETELGLEMVRVALRWGPVPSPDVQPGQLAAVRAEFQEGIRARLTAGNLSNLINEVSNATFALDQGTLDRFFGL